MGYGYVFAEKLLAEKSHFEATGYWRGHFHSGHPAVQKFDQELRDKYSTTSPTTDNKREEISCKIDVCSSDTNELPEQTQDIALASKKEDYSAKVLVDSVSMEEIDIQEQVVAAQENGEHFKTENSSRLSDLSFYAVDVANITFALWMYTGLFFVSWFLWLTVFFMVAIPLIFVNTDQGRLGYAVPYNAFEKVVNVVYSILVLSSLFISFGLFCKLVISWGLLLSHYKTLTE